MLVQVCAHVRGQHYICVHVCPRQGVSSCNEVKRSYYAPELSRALAQAPKFAASGWLPGWPAVAIILSAWS